MRQTLAYALMITAALALATPASATASGYVVYAGMDNEDGKEKPENPNLQRESSATKPQKPSALPLSTRQKHGERAGSTTPQASSTPAN